jgi:hypothetical protein
LKQQGGDMEKVEYTTTCDICGKLKYERYEYLKANQHWTKYKYVKDWQEGVHRGQHTLEYIVCDKCDKGRGVRFLFYKMKHLLERKFARD